MRPAVSVIVPNYNHAPFLKQRMQSILSQTFTDFEIILLDDCSTDNSQEILQQYATLPQTAYVEVNKKNSGRPFLQWEKGIEKAHGEWIWIAETDDWCEPELLENLIKAANENKECGLAYCTTIHEYGSHSWCPTYDKQTRYHTSSDFLTNNLLTKNTLCNASGLIFRRDIFMSVDTTAFENMRLCADWMLYAHICAQCTVAEVSLPLNHYRIHQHNSSTSKAQLVNSFIEGIAVVDYISSLFKINTSRNNTTWAKQWAKASALHKFSCHDNISIAKTFTRRHTAIVILFLFLNPWYTLRKKTQLQ
ncbi:MAG: glycosyltransferase family 2 protein [Bacteroidales bacterium]|nr:glycosyltransferase family 2 protein [Bacteroidales bacterium]MBR1799438.1 glycosyltransferase family 2 protein [Bacteroidales bacterium]